MNQEQLQIFSPINSIIQSQSVPLVCLFDTFSPKKSAKTLTYFLIHRQLHIDIVKQPSVCTCKFKNILLGAKRRINRFFKRSGYSFDYTFEILVKKFLVHLHRLRGF